MNENVETTPVMQPDEKRDFTHLLFQKLAYLLSLRALGKNTSSVEDAVKGQIHDTISTGDPKKA